MIEAASRSCPRGLSPLGFRHRRALGSDAFEQNARRLVIRVLRDELAAERLGEDGGFEAVEERPGAGGLGFEAVRGRANS
jgi:hypothetical protein